MLERLCTRFSATMRRLGDTRAEVVGATRFFRNSKVTATAILATAVAQTALIAAVKVMQCVQARGEAGTRITALRVFAPDDLPVLSALVRKLEGKTLKQKNHHPPDSLAWASWVIARLGGWTGYAKERPPGPITMLEGLTRYTAIAQGFALAKQWE